MALEDLHFLLAEGDAHLRRSVLGMLTQLGAGRVTEAADGAAALAAFYAADEQAQSVDIGLIDLALPGMDGLELVRHLGEGGSKAGVILMGAQTSAVLFSAETMAQAYGVKVLGTLGYPVNVNRLEALIEQHLQPLPGAQPARRVFAFAEVEAALAAGEFAPFFQPKIELETGQIKGLEMFARWIHPHYGELAPASFIDALEGCGRVDLLDWSMISASVAACRFLHDAGIPLSISINLAPTTLAQPSFMAQMDAILDEHRILPDYITFEMTESAVSTDPYFLERLLRLRMRGFGLAIDDYGTASSNLQLLARVPFSELKIDRSFVDGASRRHALGTVLASCLSLARSLDRPSVAVGVETKEDWDFLQRLGCTYAQGFYIARPMAVQAFPAWLKDWRQFF
jgi:EAL domain-containing protein (putative c-di-GMP-specific phosphodiesterase class I)/CheY-like chemotaxis protein